MPITWPLASTLVAVLAVGAMALWYERSRPPARTVALVATMAALAVAGRIAFAPIPNVKPTTDIVLMAGIAFGGLPGFAVGAITALISNLFFGHGLHTPWQMLAWGGVGLIGAGLGRLVGPSPGRWTLAGVAALCGLLFSAFMDFSVWLAVGVEHTFAEYLTILVRSAPFALAHPAGNFVFAFAFGPVMLRALARARERASVTFGPRLGAEGASSNAPSVAPRSVDPVT